MKFTAKNPILPSFVSVLLVVFIILPSVVKIKHALFEHLEVKCKNINATHIHKGEFDCDFHKYNLSAQDFPPVYTYTSYLPEILKGKTFGFYFSLIEHQKLHFSLRGPPTVS